MTYQQLWKRLENIYGEGEAKAIARMVYEVRYGLSLSDLLMGRDADISPTELEEIAGRLEQCEPVQYVLGQTDFCGRSFLVNRHVLIPRPETEELIQLIADTQPSATQILDIGTGSGCIAITLATMFPEAKVTAWDISEEALSVARENAKRTHVNVSFEQVDVLSEPTASGYDLIVSNPPYICNQERKAMEQNVLDYEPHVALFVPDNNPLLFYRAIADLALHVLMPEGWLYFEINPVYAEPLRQMLIEKGYRHIYIQEDQFGKQRMIRAQR